MHLCPRLRSDEGPRTRSLEPALSCAIVTIVDRAWHDRQVRCQVELPLASDRLCSKHRDQPDQQHK